ncbi:hypothetical protein B0H13DRAFT_2665419 [Mycena leptocephala]|nr:hypothetical protein B0H13DRAFT_2665419 [Mycena leptocephala]
MCDTISISIILGALALVSSITSRYVCLALATASFIFSHARHQAPAQKFAKLEDAIKALEDILELQLLEMRSATWKTYFKSIRAILQIINQCAKEVKEIQTAMLLIIEEERQRKLTEGIKETQAALGAVVRSQIRRAYRRSESDPLFQEFYNA